MKRSLTVQRAGIGHSFQTLVLAGTCTGPPASFNPELWGTPLSSSQAQPPTRRCALHMKVFKPAVA